jgi:hypothetical protein
MAKKVDKKKVAMLIDKVIAGKELNNAEKQMINARLLAEVRIQAMKIKSGYDGVKIVNGGRCSPR